MAEVIIPHNTWGNPLTPIEQTTRVPLPVWAPVDGGTNRHHAHYYAKQFENGPRQSETRAVRFSRLQRVAVGPHKAMHEHFDGAAMPQTTQEAFMITVLCSAGYVPNHVIDLTNYRRPLIVETNRTMRRELRTPGVLTTEVKRNRRAEIGQFLMQYALDQDFDDSETSRVEQFLSISDEDVANDELAAQRRLRLGLRLTGKAIEAAVDPLDQLYREARTQDMLSVNAPACAWLAVHTVVQGHEHNYFDALAERLQVVAC